MVSTKVRQILIMSRTLESSVSLDLIVFFFSSRRRHTRSDRDWSSDVCSSDLIGNGWGGGLVPFITAAAFLSSGSVGYALIYPITVPAVCFLICLFVMPETRHNRIWGPEKAQAVGS